MRIGLRYKNKKIEVDAKICNWFEKFSGLMFTRRENSSILLFDFGESSDISIHSFFVFFPFLAVWLDDKDDIIESRVVRPFEFNICPKKSYSKLVEIPLNRKYNHIIKILVGDGKI